MMRYIGCLMLIFLCAVSQTIAQKDKDVQNYNGMKTYYGVESRLLQPPKWKAKWIWREGERYAKNVMLSARKTFNLDQKPEKSLLYITADSHYTLWVNGEFINRGPARSAAHHQSYDILDISSKLVEGKNVIAVRIHHLGTVPTYRGKARPGLLFQLEIPISSGKIFITSDSNVKVKNENGWDSETPKLWCCTQAHVENFDYRKSVRGWKQPEFDDSGWENAKQLQPIGWWPFDQGEDRESERLPPWHTLVPRDIPYLEYELTPVQSVFETGEAPEFSTVAKDVVEHIPILDVIQHQIQPLEKCKIENIEGFIRQDENLTIYNYYPESLYSNEPIRSTWLVFDMGKLLKGYPRLEIEGSSQTEVEITYAPFLFDGKFNPAMMLEKYGDRVTLSGDKVIWEAQELRTFRYLGLLISNTEKPVNISWVGVRQVSYPFTEVPSIELGDPMLEKLYSASQKTLKIITHDAYTDNYQERRQYIQTAWYAARANYSMFGDPYLMRRLLIQHAQDQHPNGIFPMHAPGDPYAGILESDFFWHMSLYDYFMYTGDTETTKRLLLNLKRSLRALEDLENRHGLIESPPYPYWIDHTNLDRRGINFTLNSWYMMALEKDAEIFHYFEMEEEAKKYKQKADNIRQYLKDRFWDKEKGLFVQAEVKGKQSDSYDEISNGLALATGIADENQAKFIAKKIVRNDTTQEMVRPVLMMYWPIEGLFSAGHGKEAVQLLKKRYKKMIQHQEGTLWEGWNLYGNKMYGEWRVRTFAATQAEQVYHPDIIKRHIFGLEVLEPGMKKVRISYNKYGFGDIEGVFPTPYGNITIERVLDDKKRRLNISYPDTIDVIVDSQSFPENTQINLNN